MVISLNQTEKNWHSIMNFNDLTLERLKHFDLWHITYTRENKRSKFVLVLLILDFE